MKIAVVIPAYNEAKSIGPLVEGVRAQGYDCIVIDDGSSDGTDAIALAAGAQVLKTGGRSGKGNALKMGFGHVLQQGHDALIAMDGDGQHLPSDIPGLVSCCHQMNADIVCGNRMGKPKGMPFVRFMTNHFMSGLISLFCHQHIPDTQCGFRLIKTDVLRALQLESSDFEIETEVLIKASKKKFKIASSGIQTVYDGQVSKIQPLRDTGRFITYLWRESFRRK
ncbi:MAG: glycosyltransferase family 2 protein [Candidatus Omnitrophica bacterium]|nr:glycosyltransferase family 2 protein [Candidatus Omnitrophota bacterium]